MVSLSKQEFEDGIGIVRKAANEDVLEDINKLAASIANEGDNALKDTLLEQCKKYQAVYNQTFKPAIDSLIKVFDESFEYAEHMEKASVGELSTTDAGFETKGLNPGSVNI
jgi:hypothetical protein